MLSYTRSSRSNVAGKVTCFFADNDIYKSSFRGTTWSIVASSSKPHCQAAILGILICCPARRCRQSDQSSLSPPSSDSSPSDHSDGFGAPTPHAACAPPRFPVQCRGPWRQPSPPVRNAALGASEPQQAESTDRWRSDRLRSHVPHPHHRVHPQRWPSCRV